VQLSALKFKDNDFKDDWGTIFQGQNQINLWYQGRNDMKVDWRSFDFRDCNPRSKGIPFKEQNDIRSHGKTWFQGQMGSKSFQGHLICRLK
jgi:hypothetical protein